jgi:hypothetical protein
MTYSVNVTLEVFNTSEFSGFAWSNTFLCSIRVFIAIENFIGGSLYLYTICQFFSFLNKIHALPGATNHERTDQDIVLSYKRFCLFQQMYKGSIYSCLLSTPFCISIWQFE